MLRQATLFVSVLCVLQCAAQTKPSPSPTSTAFEKTYDPELAKRLGADEYGMKNYVLCFLEPGEQRLMMVSELEALQLRHFQYMQRLTDSGLVVMAGLFTQNPLLLEQYVFNTTDTAVADSLMKNDPMVKERLMFTEFHHWYGPAALPELKAIHERVQKTKMETGE